MSEFPDRIWASPNGEYWSTEDIGSGVDVEYIRKDVSDASVAAEREAFHADWIAARIREFDGGHEKGAGAIGEYIAEAIRAQINTDALAAYRQRVRAEALREGFLLGFKAAGEGYNGEFPFADSGTCPDSYPEWRMMRENNLSTLTGRARSNPSRPTIARH